MDLNTAIRIDIYARIVVHRGYVQMFGMNMPFISSSELKNTFFMSFEASQDEINGICMTNIDLFLLYTILNVTIFCTT